MSQTKSDPVVIVGGGISGLSAAFKLIDRGVPAASIHLYEADKRVGGKIKSGAIGKTPIDMGAEFLSKDDEEMVALAKRLNVPLSDTTDQSAELFQSPKGRMLPDFLAQYAPIAQQVIRLRDAAENDPELANRLQAMSAQELLYDLQQSTPAQNPETVIHRIYRTMRFRANRVPEEVIATALKAMEHEQGVPATQLTAAQFIAETSPSTERFLASSLDYRVEGGTEELIKALHRHLEQQGVQFHMGHRLASFEMGKSDEKTMLFDAPNGQTTDVTARRVIMATRTYALADVRGMEFLGLDEHPVGYTRNAKFTIRVKGEVPARDANMFMDAGQVWSAHPGFLTFLVHNESGLPPTEIMRRTLDSYAGTVGKKVEDLFLIENGNPAPGSFVYTNPGKSPCWSTPSPEHALGNRAMFARMQALEAQGVGFVGTYLPDENGEVGFMEVGAQAAERTAERMFGPALVQESPASLSPRIQNILNNGPGGRSRVDNAPGGESLRR